MLEQYVTGDVIEHELMPGFRMKIREVGDCETDPTRPGPHSMYKITDPEGAEDWLCAHDVRRVS